LGEFEYILVETFIEAMGDWWWLLTAVQLIFEWLLFLYIFLNSGLDRNKSGFSDILYSLSIPQEDAWCFPLAYFIYKTIPHLKPRTTIDNWYIESIHLIYY